MKTYEDIREKLFTISSGVGNAWTARIMLSSVEPIALADLLYNLIGSDDDLLGRYLDCEFTEEDWAKIKRVCDMYHSPLMQALS
jgi:hypothetical protein